MAENSIFGSSVSLEEFYHEIDDETPNFFSGQDAKIPFLVTGESGVLGIFVPVDMSQVLLALSGQILPNLRIYNQLPAVQEMVRQSTMPNADDLR